MKRILNLRSTHFTLALFLSSTIFLFNGCGIKSDQDQSLKAQIPEINHTQNDTARILAGLSVPASSQFASFSSTPAALNFNQETDKLWQRVDARLEKVKLFRDQEITSYSSSAPVLFYPFGGPDFLNAFVMFPDEREYIYFGLEPVGSLPDLSKVSEKQQKVFYTEVKRAIETVAAVSYFRTNEMKNDLNSVFLKGTTPILSIFAVRHGNQIIQIQEVILDDRGELLDKSQQIQGKDFISGVHMQLMRKDGKRISITYFSLDISNLMLRKRDWFLEYIKSRGNFNVYLKAASYLMYDSYFSLIRNFVLTNGNMILQDDSGIPLKYYDPKKFNLTFYGVYHKPLKMFEDRYQSDLRERYKSGKNVKPIDFGTGYGNLMRQSNMMLAVPIK